MVDLTRGVFFTVIASGEKHFPSASTTTEII